MSVKVRGMVRLTRWKEYITFVIPLTLFGAILAAQANNSPTLDWRLIVVTLANVLVVAYAFMINDIEDAPDDAREAHRAARNPVASGEVTPIEGWLASGGVALITLVLYFLAGWWPFAIGCLTLAISHLYSWKPIRLKAWPVTDFVSHSLMLSGLLFLAGYFTYNTTPGAVWFVALSVTLVSCYGQIYNQIRDFEMDKAAGLKNTAILVGKDNAKYLMYSFAVVALLLMIYSLVTQVIPFWITLVVAIATPLTLILIRTKGDMRGGKSAAFSGDFQWQFIVIANIIIAVWLIVTIINFR
jgi:4-hydroxybenzoate polyprenyltransferase